MIGLHNWSERLFGKKETVVQEKLSSGNHEISRDVQNFDGMLFETVYPFLYIWE